MSKLDHTELVFLFLVAALIFALGVGTGFGIRDAVLRRRQAQEEIELSLRDPRPRHSRIPIRALTAVLLLIWAAIIGVFLWAN